LGDVDDDDGDLAAIDEAEEDGRADALDEDAERTAAEDGADVDAEWCCSIGGLCDRCGCKGAMVAAWDIVCPRVLDLADMVDLDFGWGIDIGIAFAVACIFKDDSNVRRSELREK
jgi:hypothetical protein